ncbi:BTB/POZ and TAZ domain-containing protein 1-like [Phragmites australis]|uniref:BTB/POZ and TAZ domain-containing protein 1-like n=1 Tax=Phragmites australis TaxID=29695 RepID=UPI002D78E180|nr:BTB/POZ and TAZ domain-containing protein 1-like [Phragmites australis]
MSFCADLGALRPSPTDVRIVTSDGISIAAHSSVLAAASPVLERMIVRARRGWDADCTVRILGAPSDAVVAFLRFLYSQPREAAEEWAEDAVGAHGAALLALAHVYRVPWLKRRAEAGVAARLTAERAVDALKLAGLCDAPRLYQACARLAAKDLDAVERSEGWRFAGRHDAALQLDLLRLLHDADQRKERWERERASQHVYRQLSDAMAFLDRFSTGGSSCVGEGREAEASSCDSAASVRRGLEQLMRHFAACGRTRKAASCPRCRRAVQLLRLHASVCDSAGEPCRVPLCSNLKAKMQEEGVDNTWKLLVKKVIRARVMSALANREVPEIVKKSWAKHSSRKVARFG